MADSINLSFRRPLAINFLGTAVCNEIDGRFNYCPKYLLGFRFCGVIVVPGPTVANVDPGLGVVKVTCVC